LESLDPFCYGRLGNVEFFSRNTKALVFGGQIKDFELIKIHNS
jgi:hypothetical protein